MKLYFLRHGEADWPHWNQPDDERPLTKKGRKEMEQVAKFLCELEPKISLILSSPLPRALQTAQIVADRLSLEVKAELTLGKGFDLPTLRVLLKRTGNSALMFVGHEPDFSGVIRKLTGGSVKMAKAGVARVDLNNPESDGTLVWLVPPKFAKQ